MITIPDHIFHRFDTRFPDVLKDIETEAAAQQQEELIWQERLRKLAMDPTATMVVRGTAKRVAAEVFEHIPCNMTTEVAELLGRAVLRGDRDTVFQIMSEQVVAAIKTQAEIMSDPEN